MLRCEGCGGVLSGRQRRYCSSRCRARARRLAAAVARAGVSAAPPMQPGLCRAGLDDWLDQLEDPPAALVAHARVLAEQVDAAPRESPLHGRYSTVLGMLLAAQRPELDAAAIGALRALQTGCDDPTHRWSPPHCGGCCAARRGDTFGNGHTSYVPRSENR